MGKASIILYVLLLAAFALQGCSSGDSDPETTNPLDSTGTETEVVMTLDELSEYDGKDGNPAYIAVDGMIYDVTDIPQWKDGEHNGFSAGQDLTDEINNISPHGISKLKGISVIGKLED